MTAPLQRVRSRTPKVAETCLLDCGHVHHHGDTDMPCDVRAHRCIDCANGRLPMFTVLDGGAVMFEGEPG